MPEKVKEELKVCIGCIISSDIKCSVNRAEWAEGTMNLTG